MSRPLRVAANYKTKDPAGIILGYLANHGSMTLPELGKRLNISVPKVTVLVSELRAEGLVSDYGKVDSSGGRKPSLYGVAAEAAYFIGVDVKQSHITIGLLNLDKTLVGNSGKMDYELTNTVESRDTLCGHILDFITGLSVPKDRIKGVGINLSGRVNYRTGHSYSYFHFDDRPLSEIVEEKIGFPVFLENDSRAMAYGEFCLGAVENEKDVLFLNLDYGIAVGILMGGELYYGKSGYAGEFGHMPVFQNEYICRCGKKGCLETEAAGWALERMFRDKVREGSSSLITTRIAEPDRITMDDIIEAAMADDVLAIELIAQLGDNIGRGIASLINVFNPELVILGGGLLATGDYIGLPIKTAINKYSLSLVNNDTRLVHSKLGEDAGLLGACLLVRNRFLGIHD
ncbi:putative NBD/HSP70 family sugar kinase [Dyadobacter sp. BE34]|uniref:NBD/HSP70 family sugar kinase n=1 Tax=Dyadobacter fermentans TaxID=94254 RepID=A0ABU1QT73_9BACT|nr:MULTISPECIES: ROK family transcriptional regulator [Dyadobacter]MDR6804364.1 putative NBD/HSP70 family sugar kinase [Dyadobacter fermentans]MDR7042104.1 putative NBD/HSP70 family sugar kinase [Dyadobacter sp. BE242]MDR7196507.1 putative NBD/HSP70 family sugar kinase [Dyadobacter sp. BE34]MDR7212948.1 putative NBD/HSP70 family sugar kinase [Dyadobacter sp. BE31]MDR7261913.1 putative NBD/HSP70 family sugar kinase [Dyadobacter sp. BE32]